MALITHRLANDRTQEEEELDSKMHAELVINGGHALNLRDAIMDGDKEREAKVRALGEILTDNEIRRKYLSKELLAYYQIPEKPTEQELRLKAELNQWGETLVEKLEREEWMAEQAAKEKKQP